MTRQLRPLVLAAHGWTCHLCGGQINRTPEVNAPDALTLDHVIPLARGGGNGVDNLRPAHRRCNTAKGARVAA